MLPGEQLAQQILQTDTIHAMQLVVFLVVLGWVIATWLNGRAVAQMSTTQRDMSHTNERFIEADSKKTAVLQAIVDETRALREDFGETYQRHQTALETTIQVLRRHDDRVEERLRMLVTQMTSMNETQTRAMQKAVTDLVGEAVLSMGESAVEAVKPALDALIEIKASITAISLLQQGQMEVLKQQQHEQLDLLKGQHEAHMRLLESQLMRAEHVILQSVKPEMPNDEF